MQKARGQRLLRLAGSFNTPKHLPVLREIGIKPGRTINFYTRLETILNRVTKLGKEYQQGTRLTRQATPVLFCLTWQALLANITTKSIKSDNLLLTTSNRKKQSRNTSIKISIVYLLENYIGLNFVISISYIIDHCYPLLVTEYTSHNYSKTIEFSAYKIKRNLYSFTPVRKPTNNTIATIYEPHTSGKTRLLPGLIYLDGG